MITQLMCHVTFPWFEWAFIVPPIVAAVIAHGFIVRHKAKK